MTITAGHSSINASGSKTMDRMDMGNGQIVQDIKAVVSDAEALMHATAGDVSERAVKARARAEESLRHARNRIIELEQQMMERAKAAAQATDGYVHENPWPSIGIAAGVAFVAGLLVGRR
jgi:ElaB/YqjD/DUF883 family membrane-anchored ribosome-binding protein